MSQYLSKKDLVKEIVKCGKDPVYFIDNYCKIAHPQRGQIAFKTWDFQQELLHKFNDYRNNVILKSRQMGISTISAAYVSWMMLFHRDKNILVIATKFSTAANLVKKVKAMIKMLPPWFDQLAQIAIDNRSSFVLNNGSEIKASSTSADAGRSEALSLLVIDEAAHIDGFDDLWTALQPTMAAGGRCIALSSPNGVGNWFDRNFWIWKEYDPNHKYLLVGDVSRGDGNDYSVFHVFNISTMEQVAEYRGKPTMDLFSRILFDAGKEYGDAMLVVENNNIGFSVLEKLIDAGYPNLYHSIKGTHEYVEQYRAESLSNSVPGFTTSQKTRPLIVAKLEEFIRNELITINSSRSFKELKTFVWKNGRPEAQRGYNDDLVMSLSIACWIRDTVLEESERDLQYKRAFLNSMMVSNTKLNTTIPGMQGYKKSETFDKINEAKENYKNFGWLIKG